MLDNLILTYRSEFYDKSLKKTWEIGKKSWKATLGMIFFVLLLIGLLIFGIVYNYSAFLYVALSVELIFIIVVDRLMVKQHRHYVASKQDHLKKVVLFLKTAVPDKNLYSVSSIEQIIGRLNNRIETHAPFNKLIRSIVGYFKVIVFPIVAFVAGAFAGDLRKLVFKTVVVWAVSIVLVIGVLYIMLVMLTEAFQKIIFRDYNAAKALEEDLLDIKLLFFISGDNKEVANHVIFDLPI